MEKVILAALQKQNQTETEINDSLDELSKLCLTDKAVEAARVIQKKDKPDAAYFIGYGKVCEIKELAQEIGADAVVFDDILKPVQLKNLTNIIGIKVLDRTRIILDIFAMRAHSAEGKLQVQKAQISYQLSQLANQGIMLDSQTGGIGTRGPGEKKIETDKRKLRDKITLLNRQIELVKQTRKIRKSLRNKTDLPEIAIVGYTNAGKSTLLKNLSKTEVYADDKLFATLDPLTRKVRLPNGREVLFTDTVGFINKLPHSLVDAFKATMEEILDASAIVHVVDAQSPNRQKQMDTVLAVLKEIGAQNLACITVFNKADLIDEAWKKVLRAGGNCVICAKDSQGFDDLLNAIEAIVSPKHEKRIVRIKYNNLYVLSLLYQLANIKESEYMSDFIQIDLECSETNWTKIKKILNSVGENYD